MQSHIYADGPNDYTVTVKVTEAGPGTPPSGQATFAVHVNNVAPSGTLGNNRPISEGGSATISFSGVSDPSAADNSRCTRVQLHGRLACGCDVRVELDEQQHLVQLLRRPSTPRSRARSSTRTAAATAT